MKHPEDVKVGDHVMFVLSDGPSKGEARPAVVVRVWTAPLVNLAVFVDGTNDTGKAHTGDRGDNPIMWVTSVEYSAASEYRRWHYPD